MLPLGSRKAWADDTPVVISGPCHRLLGQVAAGVHEEVDVGAGAVDEGAGRRHGSLFEFLQAGRAR